MRKSEKIVKEIYEKNGFRVLSNGCPDFLCYKEKKGKILEVEFVEVKADKDRFSQEQIKWGQILKSLGLNYKVVKKDNISPKKSLSITIDKDVLAKLKEERGSVALSAHINNLLKKHLEAKDE